MKPLAEMMWVIILMTTTVGYGDLAPVTTIGRSICLFASIWGVSSFSLFILTINNGSSLNDDESEVYDAIVIANQEHVLKKRAGLLIKAYLIYLLRYKREIKNRAFKNPNYRDKNKCIIFLDMIKYAHFFFYERRIV